MFCSFVFAYEPWKLPAHSTTSCARKRVHASTVVAAEGESILDVANANTHTDDYDADVLGRFFPPACRLDGVDFGGLRSGIVVPEGSKQD